MRFLHISDTHFLKDYKTNNDIFRNSLLAMDNPMSQLKKILEQINKPIDFIVHTGDVCHDGNLTDYRCFNEKMKTLFGTIPMFITCGNHDNVKVFLDVYHSENAERFFKVYHYNNIRLISFDSTDESNEHGSITKQDCELLLNALDQDKEVPTIIFTHHHLKKGQFDLPVASTDAKFNEVFRHGNIIGVLCGHTHHFYEGNIYDIPYYTADSLSFSAERSEKGLTIEQRPGINLFEFDNEELTIKRVDGGEVVKVLDHI